MSFDLASLGTLIQTWWTNFTSNATSNLSSSFSSLSIRDYLRLVWIVGGYMFLRPYIDKAFRKLFETGQSKADAAQAQAEREEMEKSGGAAKVSANALRGELAEESDSDADADVGHATGVPQWGKSARRKQRKFMEYLERKAEEMKNEEEDKDIEEFLED